MRDLLLACALVGFAACTSAPTAPPRPSLSERLVEACHEFASNGYDPAKLAGILHGRVESDDLLKGIDFVSAIHARIAEVEEVTVHFEPGPGLDLGMLKRKFGNVTRATSGKVASAAFESAPPPCGSLFIAARLSATMVNDKAPVESLVLRRRKDYASSAF